jgi:hypothetical protein
VDEEVLAVCTAHAGLDITWLAVGVEVVDRDEAGDVTGERIGALGRPAEDLGGELVRLRVHGVDDAEVARGLAAAGGERPRELVAVLQLRRPCRRLRQ